MLKASLLVSSLSVHQAHIMDGFYNAAIWIHLQIDVALAMPLQIASFPSPNSSLIIIRLRCQQRKTQFSFFSEKCGLHSQRMERCDVCENARGVAETTDTIKYVIYNINRKKTNPMSD